MKFEPGKMYRHINFKDVDMYVTGAEELSDKYQLTVRYWNRFSMMLQGGPDKVEIKKADLINWYPLS